MKIYCSCCDKVQPVQVDDCQDAKTDELYQDIVCAECKLVIASGTDIPNPEQVDYRAMYLKVRDELAELQQQTTLSAKNLHELSKFLLDLHFIQANAIVGAELQGNKQAIKYMKRIADLRELIKLEAGIKEKKA